MGTTAIALGIVREACAVLAVGSWCALAYYTCAMVGRLRPGLSPWSPGLLWNPVAVFRAPVLTEAGLVCRARARHALLAWTVAAAGAALLSLVAAPR